MDRRIGTQGRKTAPGADTEAAIPAIHCPPAGLRKRSRSGRPATEKQNRKRTNHRCPGVYVPL
jgi:hypothetical protein